MRGYNGGGTGARRVGFLLAVSLNISELTSMRSWGSCKKKFLPVSCHTTCFF